ncbi:auxin efflux carrier [Rhizopogon vinicolor AM-OR11-026]|uniref:Auxin efflux carrier n=1 Tax=Rhizopogon vinicolor AM-OR11-026 TaxID=1314800 RepID=A0A1B7N3L5_9AGAM|nr:auxin efflux carrier [Rhizopogon vinicolor AM-OR11-026]
MSTISTSTLIWISVQPLIRLFLCVGCGFAATKAGLFPAAAARGAGQIIINVTLPNMMFSRIVPAFSSSNISQLGPLVLIALIYMLIGIAISWFIKLSFWVPHRFRYGILVAGGWANIGDIPTSVALSIMASAPFNGAQDENLAVGYIAAFILVFSVTLFPLGGYRFVMMDYNGPDLENEQVKQSLDTKHAKTLSDLAAGFAHLKRISLLSHSTVKETHAEAGQTTSEKESFNVTLASEGPVTTPYRAPTVEDAGISFVDEHPSSAEFPSSPPSTVAQPVPLSTDGAREVSETFVVAPASRSQKVIGLAFQVLQSFMSPPSLSIIISFIISVIPPLKALFVTGVPGTHIHLAPDGQPPLAFIMNTAAFIGAASVPMGLITLGSALARLNLPRNQWKSLPLCAIGSLALGRLIVMPVLGVLICQGLAHIGLIDPSNNVLRFVCIFMSCLPSATTQVFLTQVYSGTGNAEHLSAFLIPQYIIMFVSMTATTAFTLHLLFE